MYLLSIIYSSSVYSIIILEYGIPLRPRPASDEEMYVPTDSNPAYGLNPHPTASYSGPPTDPEQDESNDYEICEVANIQP